jgi:putative addiction module component (TIGR02574 family)
MATPAAAKVIAEALALSDEERAAVAEELLASLDPTQSDDSPEAVAAFKAVLDRRWAAYQSGEEPGIPWPEVRARLRARLNRGWSSVAWRIEWTPAAAVEAEAEAAKYALKREGLGDRFLDEIDATIERITEGPEHFQRWPDDPSYRRAVVHVFPFVVFYRIDEPRHTVLIVSVAPAKREPGYWK